MAVTVWIFLQIFLVIFLCRIIIFQQQTFYHDRLVIILCKLCQLFANNRFLLRIGIIDTSAVLAALVLSLTVEAGRINRTELEAQKLRQR